MKKYDMPSKRDEAFTLHEPGERTLELPFAPDFKSRPSRIPLDRMVWLVDQYRQWFPPTEAMLAERAKRKCRAEFIL